MNHQQNQADAIVIGAGAAGMLCAIEAGKRGRRVLLLDHAANPGEKIRISGGGRCNFTNRHAAPKHFISNNPKFAVSALRRYTPEDFIAIVDAHGIPWHEKTLGQLFCDRSSRDIIELLIRECAQANVDLRLNTEINSVAKNGDFYEVSVGAQKFSAPSLVIATGGKSIPKMGATDFAYSIARQFELNIIDPRPALVPLTFDQSLLAATKDLSGVSCEAIVSCNRTAFREAMLFTHRGLSGPSILQISSYWREGDELKINLTPDNDIQSALRGLRENKGGQQVSTALATLLPSRLATSICTRLSISGKIGEYSNKALDQLAAQITAWTVKPVGSEGFRTAEVTLGGVDTDALSSKTMEVKSSPGLYFIGEAVDVTGWLGGYNFQWAWASGWAAGQDV